MKYMSYRETIRKDRDKMSEDNEQSMIDRASKTNYKNRKNISSVIKDKSRKDYNHGQSKDIRSINMFFNRQGSGNQIFSM